MRPLATFYRLPTFYFVSGRGVKCCGLFCISQKSHVRNLQNFVYKCVCKLGVTAVCYAIPVLLMTSCFHIMWHLTLSVDFLQCFDAVGWAAGRASGL